MASNNRRERHEFVMNTLEQHERALTRYATRLLGGDLASGRDVVQHAFLKLCQQDHVDLQDRVAPWLYRVCRNRAIDLMRGRNNQQQLDETACLLSVNGFAPSESLEQQDLVEHLKNLIDQLPTAQQEIVELWSNGFSSQEVGEIVGKKAGSVRTTLHRALQALRDHESVRRWLGEEVA